MFFNIGRSAISLATFTNHWGSFFQEYCQQKKTAKKANLTLTLFSFLDLVHPQHKYNNGLSIKGILKRKWIQKSFFCVCACFWYHFTFLLFFLIAYFSLKKRIYIGLVLCLLFGYCLKFPRFFIRKALIINPSFDWLNVALPFALHFSTILIFSFEYLTVFFSQ